MGTSGAAERPLVVKVVSADFGYQTADKADLILWTTSFTVLVINDLLKIPTTPAIFWRFWRPTHAAIGRAKKAGLGKETGTESPWPPHPRYFVKFGLGDYF